MASKVRYAAYENEQKRLSTFTNYPKKYPPKEDLAKAGLYYIGSGKNDDCRCYHCGIRIHNWNKEDIPIVEHRKCRPNCEVVKAYEKSYKGQDTKSAQTTVQEASYNAQSINSIQIDLKSNKSANLYTESNPAQTTEQVPPNNMLSLTTTPSDSNVASKDQYSFNRSPQETNPNSESNPTQTTEEIATNNILSLTTIPSDTKVTSKDQYSFNRSPQETNPNLESNPAQTTEQVPPNNIPSLTTTPSDTKVTSKDQYSLIHSPQETNPNPESNPAQTTEQDAPNQTRSLKYSIMHSNDTIIPTQLVSPVPDLLPQHNIADTSTVETLTTAPDPQGISSETDISAPNEVNTVETHNNDSRPSPIANTVFPRNSFWYYWNAGREWLPREWLRCTIL